MPRASALVLQDYDKGALSDPRALISIAADANVPTVVDPKHKPFSAYQGATVLKPNAQEFETAVGPYVDDDELLVKAQAVASENQIAALVVTRGGLGMTAVAADGAHQHIPARGVDVFDVTGAGDTAAAALGVTLSLGWTPLVCAQVANVASGIVVGKTGTAVVTGLAVMTVSADGQVHKLRSVYTAVYWLVEERWQLLAYQSTSTGPS